MVSLLLTTTISCTDALGVLNRLQKVIGLSQQQKIEILKVVHQTIPTCPVKIENNERTK
jgi:hypothetical protein